MRFKLRYFWTGLGAWLWVYQRLNTGSLRVVADAVLGLLAALADGAAVWAVEQT